MASEDYDNVTIFGRSVNLEQEWQTIAKTLSSQSGRNDYIEYEKEIARLKLKIIHMQEEVGGCRNRNARLSTMNDDLVERVKKLISMQDDQLEQYSIALVLLKEERKELRRALAESRRSFKQLEESVNAAKTQVGGSSESDVVTVVEAVRAVESNSDNESVSGESNGKSVPVSRNLDSCESSEESHDGGRQRVQRAPSRLKAVPGSFVNSMVEKLEQKHKFKSFDEPCDPPTEDESLAGTSSSVEVDELKQRLVDMESEVLDLRDTCQTLSNMLEKTVEEMQPSALSTSEDTKDQLIACLRSRLFEAICDLMKVETPDVRSVACGSSLPRPDKADNTHLVPVATQSDPGLASPRSKASKLKALSEYNHNKMKLFTCWRPKTAEDSA